MAVTSGNGPATPQSIACYACMRLSKPIGYVRPPLYVCMPSVFPSILHHYASTYIHSEGRMMGLANANPPPPPPLMLTYITTLDNWRCHLSVCELGTLDMDS